MNYQHHYNLLIERQKNRTLEGYTERHHIVPRCMGGKDDISNLVDLTAREHFVQHQLLAKIYPDEPKLTFAVNMMSVSGQTHQRTENRRYQWVRERHQKQMSELMKANQAGEGNSQFGTKWIHKGTESKKVPKDSLKQWLDDGWEVGRKPQRLKYKAPKQQKFLDMKQKPVVARIYKNSCALCRNVFDTKNKRARFCTNKCQTTYRYQDKNGHSNTEWWLKYPENDVLQAFDELKYVTHVAKKFGHNIKSANKKCMQWFAQRGRFPNKQNRYKK